MAKFSQVIAAGASFTALLGWLPVADAAIIRSPISVTTDSSGNINSTIDQSGLTIGFNSGVDDFDDYFALDPLHSVIFSSWVGDYGDITPTFDYDLGHIFEIDRLAPQPGTVTGDEHSGMVTTRSPCMSSIFSLQLMA